MKSFYLRFQHSDVKVQQTVALLPWGHTVYLMDKFGSDDDAIMYYAQETIAKGWSRSLLTNAVKLQMYEKQSPKPIDNNFSTTLPAEQASYANEVLKSTYNLGFLGVTEPVLELELERRLVENFRKEVERIVTEGTMRTAYLKDINKIKCPVPPLSEQKKIAARLSSIEKKIEVETEIKDCYAQQREYLLRMMFV